MLYLELLMEEFRRAHRRMFGQLNADANSIPESANVTDGVSKDKLRPTNSLPETKTTPHSPLTNGQNNNGTPLRESSTRASPPPVPTKKSTVNCPIVTISTYQNTSKPNRFISSQNHRSVIQIRQEDNSTVLSTINNNLCSTTKTFNNKNSSSANFSSQKPSLSAISSPPPITIKFINTNAKKQSN